MIKFDSPLRMLPPGLSRRQSLTLDGIRHAAEIATLANKRLIQTLTEIACADSDAPTAESAERITSAYLDAWAIVDSIDRLRTLAQLLPESAESAGGIAIENSKLDGVRKVRNVSDHLAQRVDYVIAHGTPALGRLAWITMTGHLKGLSCMLVPGTLAPTLEATAVSPEGKMFRPPTDHIRLDAGEHSASLSEAMETGQRMVEGVERGLRQAIEAHGLEGKFVGADIMVRMKIGK